MLYHKFSEEYKEMDNVISFINEALLNRKNYKDIIIDITNHTKKLVLDKDYIFKIKDYFTTIVNLRNKDEDYFKQLDNDLNDNDLNHIKNLLEEILKDYE